MIVFNVNYILCLYLIQIALKLHAKKSVLRIVGGHDGDPKTYQNIVRMELKIEGVKVKFLHICTATALSPVWVLTAAHCIAIFERVALTRKLNRKGVIRYGSALPWTNDSFSDIIALKKHPSYTRLVTTGHMNVKNDIGLMKTAPIHLDHYGKISALDYMTLLGHEVVTTGYGHTQDGEVLGSTLNLNKTLQVLKVLVNKCTSESQKVLYPSLCLSRQCGHASSVCPGDSGGPLLHPSGVVGVNAISFIFDCYPETMKTQTTWLARATPVSPYIDWITNHIKQNGT